MHDAHLTCSGCKCIQERRWKMDELLKTILPTTVRLWKVMQVLKDVYHLASFTFNFGTGKIISAFITFPFLCLHTCDVILWAASAIPQKLVHAVKDMRITIRVSRWQSDLVVLELLPTKSSCWTISAFTFIFNKDVAYEIVLYPKLWTRKISYLVEIYWNRPLHICAILKIVSRTILAYGLSQFY